MTAAMLEAAPVELGGDPTAVVRAGLGPSSSGIVVVPSAAQLAQLSAAERATLAAAFADPTARAHLALPTLHPGQQRIAGAGARFRVVMCGRRYGKTVLGVREACEAVLAGRSVGWFAGTYKIALEAWRDCVRILRGAAERVSEVERRVELANGGLLEVWTLDDPDAGRSRHYDLAVIDEAGLVRSLRTIWQQAIRPTLVDRRGRALFLGTSKGAKSDFVALFNHAQAGGEWAAFRAPTSDNPYIDPSEIASAKAELPPAVFAQEFLGIPADDGTHPIGLDAIAAAVAPASSEPVVAWGVDLARAQDWCVAYGFDWAGRWVRVERWQAPWRDTKARLTALLADTPAVVDSTGVGDPIVEDLSAAGCDVTRYTFTAQSRRALIERIVTALHAKSHTIPDGWLRAELESLEVTWSASGPRHQVPDGLHDDGIMALGLAIHAHDRVAVTVPHEQPWRAPIAPHDPNRDLRTLLDTPAAGRAWGGDTSFDSLGEGW